MLDVGTWGIGLFANDTAADLRDDFRSVVRAPWNGDRLVAWAIARYPSATDPADTDYPVLWLAITDLFWTYGIDHPETFSRAEQVIADGTDLAALRLLGMAPRDLDRRARVLAGLAERWRTPNPKPRPRRILATPERFMLDVGDVLAYTMDGDTLRNPYVGPRMAERFFSRHPWVPDGWGGAIVLNRFHKHEVFARYVIAIVAAGEPDRIDPASLAERSILHTWSFGTGDNRRVHAVEVSRLHLARMQVEIVASVSVATERVAAELAPDSYQIAHFGTDGSLASRAAIGGVSARIVPADDPISRYLR